MKSAAGNLIVMLCEDAFGGVLVFVLWSGGDDAWQAAVDFLDVVFVLSAVFSEQSFFFCVFD